MLSTSSIWGTTLCVMTYIASAQTCSNSCLLLKPLYINIRSSLPIPPRRATHPTHPSQTCLFCWSSRCIFCSLFAWKLHISTHPTHPSQTCLFCWSSRCVFCSLFAWKLHISTHPTYPSQTCLFCWSSRCLFCSLFAWKLHISNPLYPSLAFFAGAAAVSFAAFLHENCTFQPTLPIPPRRASFAGVAAVSFAAFLHENCIFQPTLPIPPRRASFAGVAAVSFAAFLHENCIFQPTLPIPCLFCWSSRCVFCSLFAWKLHISTHPTHPLPFLLEQPLCLLQPFFAWKLHISTHPTHPSQTCLFCWSSRCLFCGLFAWKLHISTHPTHPSQTCLFCFSSRCVFCSLLAWKLHISHFLISGASGAKLLCLLQPFCMKIAHFNPPYPSLPDVLQPFCMKIAFFNPPYRSLPNMCLVHCRVLPHWGRLNRRIEFVENASLEWQRDISYTVRGILRAHAQKGPGQSVVWPTLLQQDLKRDCGAAGVVQDFAF